MKQLIIITVAAFTVASVQAESALIKISAKVQEGENILSTPSVITIPGKSAQIAVTQDFTQDSNLTLPTGVIIDSLAHFNGNKISYSILLTVRETQQSEGDISSKAVSTFKTRELMLSGVAAAGAKVEAKLDQQTKLTITLEKIFPKDKDLTNTPHKFVKPAI